LSVRLIDESEVGLGWIETGPRARTSHALLVDGRVWLVDPIEPVELEPRVLALGEPVSVIQLLDRHDRDSKAIATRLRVPHHVVPETVPGTPFEVLPLVRSRFWREIALWWPEQRTLVCADALGTIPYFRAGGEPAGVHPLLRFKPPRRLLGLGVEHLLVGHGEGIHVDAAAAVDDAIQNARRRIPRWVAGVPRILRAG
jgi:hypothetical protein